MEKTLYLLEMGAFDDKITTDIKNHRIRVVENIDIFYQGEKYNLFFEFTQCTHYNYRTTNKRTGAPLKKNVQELIIKDGIGLDTQFEKLEKVFDDGTPYYTSWRLGNLEKEIWNEHHAYTKKDILEIVNKYALEKYNKVVLIETEAQKIIREIGGWREKDMIKKRDFQTDGTFYCTLGEWTEDHKIVIINRQEWKQYNPTTRGLVVTNTCEVDLVTRKITG